MVALYSIDLSQPVDVKEFQKRQIIKQKILKDVTFPKICHKCSRFHFTKWLRNTNLISLLKLRRFVPSSCQFAFGRQGIFAQNKRFIARLTLLQKGRQKESICG